MSKFSLEIHLSREEFGKVADGEHGERALPFTVCAPTSDLDLFIVHGPKDWKHHIVIGNLFDRITMKPVLPRDNPELLMSEGDPVAALLKGFWGRYVVVVVDEVRRRVEVFRDPSGQLPCYWTIKDSSILIAADVDRLATESSALDWSAVRQHLAFPTLRSQDTCIEGVHELLPGVATVFENDKYASHLRWRPLPDARCETEPTEALAERLRRVIQNSVTAWATRFPRPLLTLSGGLDSSIIAACLKRFSPGVTCLNLVSGSGRGDERQFAKAVAELCGFPLEVASPDALGVDFLTSTARGKPRPVARAFTQAVDRITTLAADGAGAVAQFNGGGGDNVLAYLHSSYPATDALLDMGWGASYRDTVQSLAMITGCSIWAIGRRSLRNAIRADQLPIASPSSDLLTAVTEESRPKLHPWLGAYDARRPGKRQHIQAVLQAIHFGEYLGARSERPTIYPFLSQPVMELCLSVPTWRWCADGRDRSLAREAFRDLLPAPVLERRVKGTFDEFVSASFYQHLSTIHTLVAEGRLVSEGIVERKAVLSLLAEPDRISAQHMSRVLHIADVESWLLSRQ